MPPSYDAVVIGGGLVGAAAAYQLARSGLTVALCERGEKGQATQAGAGILAPGTSVGRPDAWYALAFASVAHYPDLLGALEEDGETDTGFAICGKLFIVMDDGELPRFEAAFKVFQERVRRGVPFMGRLERLDAAGARDLFPALSPAVRAAAYCSGGGRVDGRRLLGSLRRACEKRGVRFLQAGAARLELAGDRLAAVHAGDERLPAASAVIAGGAWSGEFGGQLGLRLPVYPQRGQIAHLSLAPQETGAWPVISGFHTHYLVCWPGGRVVAGATREDGSGYDPRLTAAGVHEVLGEALRVAPGLAAAELLEVRVGLRPASPDFLPVIGAAPGWSGIYICTGHGPTGLQLGPYSARLVRDLIVDGRAALDLAPYGPGRFQG